MDLIIIVIPLPLKVKPCILAGAYMEMICVKAIFNTSLSGLKLKLYVYFNEDFSLKRSVLHQYEDINSIFNKYASYR